MVLRAVLVLLSSAGLCAAATPAAAAPGGCRQVESGACIRWHQSDIAFTVYAPGEPVPRKQSQLEGITNAQFEAEALATTAAWQAVECTTCMVPGQGGCVATACAANPLGPSFRYEGLTSTSHLASDCLVTPKPAACPQAAAGSAQIALIREADQWPLGAKVISGNVQTFDGKTGRLVDADVLVRDNGYVLCTQVCTEQQYPLRGVLLQEVGHMLGVGFSEQTLSYLAADFQRKGEAPPTMTEAQGLQACEIYRTSLDPVDCTVSTAPEMESSDGCSASRTGAASVAAFGLLGLLLAGMALLRRRVVANARDSQRPSF